MNLSGTWKFNELWNGDQSDEFSATFNADGTATIQQPNDGFAMVWYTGGQSGQGIVLAGDNIVAGILAVYYGTMGSDNTSMSGTANGKMGFLGGATPVTGTWTAVQTSS